MFVARLSRDPTSRLRARPTRPPARAFANEVRLPAHRGEWQLQDRPRLMLVLDGVVRLRTSERDALLPPGRAAFIPRGVPHQMRTNAPARVRWVTLWPDALDGAGVAVFDANPLLREMVAEAVTWGTFPDEGSLTDAFFTALSGLLSGWLEDEVEVDLPTARSAELRRGLDWLLDRLPHPVGPADAARQSGLSLRTFQRRCREELGLTPTDWLQRARVIRALELLTNQRLTVGEIAIKCGYQSQASFGRVFKEHIGQTPLAWRASRAAMASGM